MARIEPLTIKQWPPQMREALAAMLPPEPRHPRPVREDRPMSRNTLGTLAHHPALSRAFFTFNGHVIMATTLSERQRELLVLRVATLRQSAYEWAQHIYMGRDAGLTDEEISRIAYGPDAPFWTPLESALLRCVDELVRDGAISEPTWTVLAGELDAQQLLDVIFTVGAYETIAWMMRSFDLDLDPELVELRSKPYVAPVHTPVGAPIERQDL
ncbi:carboxymuconolactone decarboxylase family protein [Frankia sp. CNm7]|uniref:Carboxymuconolactone decarboxylase family protein n=1 Tax=Frankia nepalensis TaxID=1836974 RepID=A0A937RRD7_9ACTN|nr:carboxymuconolactone decarboxylase family protein [Frankia nepalensis]MBL7497348.1 carboxymuconolactone decarboxylase family protein [Frankia nepalensis]MBL7510922.1 carboxymuconolactone decarboxylase family protein [Frankia nepalensis]MBL7519452.1 carboxymuconolactone decarboxylase family protein [Frankia nepalensis]MBL7631959.1 carboxymuconolactone decarboxylase family protein [Frankia nepalensis]